MDLDSLLARMTLESSDLHLTAGSPPAFRIAGGLVPDPSPPLTPEDLDALLGEALPEDKLNRARQGHDFSATVRRAGRTFHFQAFRTSGCLAAAVRVIPDKIYTLDEMHLPPVFEALTACRRGLILIAGPTGSGKTTTLVSMLDHINRTRAERILTLEDPINYVLPGRLSLVTQRVVGEDVESYESGLRSAPGIDPDVVFVGELRTPEAARLALELADKGHLVFTQMTAETVADAVGRLLALLGEPADQARLLLARTVQAIIAQSLLRRADRPGRVAVNEVLLGTPRVRRMIEAGQTDAALLALAMEASSGSGMQTMDDALLGLLAGGVLSRDAAEVLIRDKARLPPG